MGTPRWIDVDSTSILRQYIEDQILTSFCVISMYFFDVISLIKESTLFPHTFWSNFDCRKIHVVSTYFFRRNFDGHKIRVFLMYFFRHNFSGQKIHVVSTYFFRCNFDGKKIRVVCPYFFRTNSNGQKFHVVCKLMKTLEEVFLC